MNSVWAVERDVVDGFSEVDKIQNGTVTEPGSKICVEGLFDSVVRSVGEAAGRGCLSHGSNNFCSGGKTISEVGYS